MLTRFQPGEQCLSDFQNRFNGLPFASDPETVKTVEPQEPP
jgi:hypothetical protein